MIVKSISNAYFKYFNCVNNFSQCKLSKRFLNVSEYIGMTILKRNGVRVPEFRNATTPEEAFEAGKSIQQLTNTPELVVKALVLTGGRGKGTFNTGFKGVEIVKSPSEVSACARGMLGNYLTTKQTVGKGLLCTEVLVAQKLSIKSERYLSFTLDRGSGGIVAIATKHGGGNVEEIAHQHPDAVLTLQISPLTGLTPELTELLVKQLSFSNEVTEQVKKTVQQLYDTFVKSDGTLLEVNPLVETHSDVKSSPTQSVESSANSSVESSVKSSVKSNVMACDAKLIVDDNAKYRQSELFDMTPVIRTKEEEEADRAGLNYISLDGNVACIVNGAGLAMATMDLIQHHGGKAANFLDVGGNSTPETLSKALEIVNSDLRAKVLLVNIVGGIVRCDKFAESFVEASKKLSRQLPVVIRLQGTRAESAKKLLNESNIPHLFCTDFDSVCKSAVEIANTN
ncbi:ATP-grasp domain protein [Theileria parva strain Muguga]|uniref:Succinyl-CoA synthetase beta chain n=1 Tax=Theileria parva TaxID=5875 RepID=Q4N7Z3_THEPA|nr:ATP-grasp domain protein [Theileria parva strain Muguga]EAN33915.1 ATP-grasp domain protein [Theileria parva strain Muguga]|eukprot:XP_766198.1 ATP-specific succinyl-CoA synthetase beta subunit [Theileria parva strain Muguga]